MTCFGQNNYPTRDSIHIFWQPNLKITYNDYKCDTTKERIKDMKQYGYYASASIGIWSVLDIPKKKKDRYKKFEKVYFAPAFERTTSAAIKNDSLQIAMQNILLDINEICARWARRELNSWKERTNATGAISLRYLCVKKQMIKKSEKMRNGFIKQAFIQKKDSAFLKWRLTIDSILNETSKWATTPEECYRLMTGKPIEKDYIMAPSLIDMCADKKKEEN